MKDLVGNDLNIGDNCYYIMNSKSGWSLSIIKIVEIKPKTIIGRVVNTNPSGSHPHKNHGGNYWFNEGDWTNAISPFTLIKIEE